MKSSAFKRIARFGHDRFTLFIVVLAGLGTAHILVRTATYGAAIFPDSTVLLSTAMNFLAGEGWQDLIGRPLVIAPPLFPLLLAASGWVGLEPLTAGRWVNATAFGLTILAAGGWMRSHLQARWLALAASGAIAASLPLNEFAASFLTDSLFVLLTLLALMQLAAFLHQGGRTPLWWAAVCTALAALTRYVGVVLIGVGVLLLLVRRAPPLAIRLKDTVVFGAVSSMPLAVALMHNWAVSGTLTGGRSGSRQSLSDSLSQVAEVFQEWVVPQDALDGFGFLLWTAAGLVVAVGVGIGVSGHGLGMGGKDGGTASPRLGLEPALPFGVFAVAYLGFLVAVVPFTVKPSIGSRFLLPVHVPLLLVAVLLLDRFLSIKAAGRWAAVWFVLASLVLLGGFAHTGYSAHRNLRITAKAYVAGFRDWKFNVSYWESSETLNYIRTHLREGRIYSNNAHLAWFWDRIAAPGKHQYLPRRKHKVMPRIHNAGADGAYIVWIQNKKPLYGYDDLYIRCLPGVETVAELADGVVFRVTAAESFDAERHRARKQRYLEQLIRQAGEPVVRAGWKVYRTGRTLIYRKEPCAPADVQAKFVLHVYPVDRADLPAQSKQYDFENLDFYFDRRGVRAADQCMEIAHLPAYPIARIRVGQWISKEDRTLWAAEFSGAGD